MPYRDKKSKAAILSQQKRRKKFAKTPLGIFWTRWNAMKQRVKKDPFYVSRNIKIEWESFLSFKHDMYDSFVDHSVKHGYRNTTLDRVNNSGNYSVKNCRWATAKQQSKNRKNNFIISAFGKTQCANDWGKETKISAETIKRRIRSGIAPELALTTPPDRTRWNKNKIWICFAINRSMDFVHWNY